MRSPPTIWAVPTHALLALLLGEEAATRLSGRGCVRIIV